MEITHPPATVDGPSLSRRIPYGLLNRLRELCSVFLQLLSINRFETQFIERHRQSFLPLQVHPIEQRFFRFRNLVRPVPSSLFFKTPEQTLADVTVDDVYRCALKLSREAGRHACQSGGALR